MDSVAPKSTARRSGRSNRPSQSQPHHRRPAWAQNERSYQRYIENPTIRENREDYGYDNFTYEPHHIVKSLMPYDLIPRLPPLLRKEAKLFVLAFASVYTAFERIEAMDKEAPHRADPQTTHEHLLSRRASDYTPAVVGAETPAPASTPAQHHLTTHSPYPPSSKRPLMPTIPQLPVNMIGLESPPFTPVDSKVANTPVHDAQHSGTNGMAAADLARVNAQLSRTALSASSSSPDSSSSSGAVKNEVAWLFYINQYNAEIADVKKHAYKRLEGYDRTITRQFFEHLHDGSLRMDQKAALQEFRFWWMHVKEKVAEIKVRVDALEEKTVGGLGEDGEAEEEKRRADLSI